MPLPLIPMMGAALGVATTIAALERRELQRERDDERDTDEDIERDEADEALGSIIAKAAPPKLLIGSIIPPTLEAIPAELGPLPSRVAKPPPSPLKQWGDGTETAQRPAAWMPSYLKSEGCKDFRWGLCMPDLVDGIIRSDPDVPDWTADIDQVVYRIANVIAAGSGKIAEWLVDRACLRFKWPLKAYTTPDRPGGEWGNAFREKKQRLWAVNRGDAGILAKMAPPSPLQPIEGWKRVWVSTVQSPGTRNETAAMVLWPDDGRVGELLSTDQIRGMLRLDLNYTGGINAKQLARADCGKSKFWFARRKKAMAEFK